MNLAETLVYTEDFLGVYQKWEEANKRWKKYWFDIFCELYKDCKEAQTIFAIKKDEMIILFKKKKKIYNYNISMIDAVDQNLFIDKDKEKVYLFRFYNNEDELVCSKVGTTKRSVNQRLKEELRSKTYLNMGCTKATIERIYDCCGCPAEGLESRLRAEYIKKYPNSFKKNDRFINEVFDLEECDRIVAEYLN